MLITDFILSFIKILFNIISFFENKIVISTKYQIFVLCIITNKIYQHLYHCFIAKTYRSIRLLNVFLVFLRLTPCLCVIISTPSLSLLAARCILTVQCQKKNKSSNPYRFELLVLVTGLEPVRYCYRGILSPLRLPISPHQHTVLTAPLLYMMKYELSRLRMKKISFLLYIKQRDSSLRSE